MQQQIRGLGPLHLDDCEDDDEDLGDLCNAETYGLVQLTSHNMQTADVTNHFFGAFVAFFGAFVGEKSSLSWSTRLSTFQLFA